MFLVLKILGQTVQHGQNIRRFGPSSMSRWLSARVTLIIIISDLRIKSTHCIMALQRVPFISGHIGFRSEISDLNGSRLAYIRPWMGVTQKWLGNQLEWECSAGLNPISRSRGHVRHRRGLNLCWGAEIRNGWTNMQWVTELQGTSTHSRRVRWNWGRGEQWQRIHYPTINKSGNRALGCKRWNWVRLLSRCGKHMITDDHKEETSQDSVGNHHSITTALPALSFGLDIELFW